MLDDYLKGFWWWINGEIPWAMNSKHAPVGAGYFVEKYHSPKAELNCFFSLIAPPLNQDSLHGPSMWHTGSTSVKFICPKPLTNTN